MLPSILHAMSARGNRSEYVARKAWLRALATALSLAAGGASAGPTPYDAHDAVSIWQEHGAGRTDGLAVGAYPLPVQPETGNRGANLATDSEAKERWLRRHYQWLRALRGVLAEPGQAADDGAGTIGNSAGFAAPSPPGALRMGDMVVLHQQDEADGIAPHLLDDGSASEDPAIVAGGDTLDLIVSDRALIESGKVVAQYFRPLRQDLPFISAGASLAARRPQPPQHSFVHAEPRFPRAASQVAGAASARPPESAQPRSVVDFFKDIATDVLSAPTTYLLTVAALIGWLILRATVFSRP